MMPFTRGFIHMDMKLSARRSSSFLLKRRNASSSASGNTPNPARSSAFTPRVSHPSLGEYEGATMPMVSPFRSAGGRISASVCDSRAIIASTVSATLGGLGFGFGGRLRENTPQKQGRRTDPCRGHRKPARGLVFVYGSTRPKHLLQKGFRPEGRSPG